MSEIYGSTQYINNPTVGDLKLEVNSQWNFSARSVCFGYAGETLISYDLKKCTKVEDSFVIGSNPPKPCKNTSWKSANITKSIVKQLEKDGYIVSKDFTHNDRIKELKAKEYGLEVK